MYVGDDVDYAERNVVRSERCTPPDVPLISDTDGCEHRCISPSVGVLEAERTTHRHGCLCCDGWVGKAVSRQLTRIAAYHWMRR